MSTWDDQRIIFRDIWADKLILLVDGKNVTRFRGKPAQIGGYQLQRPFGYGPADFAFPQVTNLEALGEGDLWWLRQEAPVRLVPVVDGVRGEDVWRGFITIPRTSDGHVQIHCDGEASGRLVLGIKPPEMFNFVKDIGRLWFASFRAVGLRCHPRLGPETGVTADSRGTGGTYLEYVNRLLATLEENGNGRTVDPVWVDGEHRYELVEKDLTTVHATVFCGTEGVIEDLADDLQERPNTFYGTGIGPNGQKWINAYAPGLIQGETPPFPMALGVMTVGTSNADTVDGRGVTILQNRLLGTAHLDREDLGDGVYDEETAEAVEDIQEARGLPVTGDVDRATWDAIYDVNAAGLSLRAGPTVLPLAQASRVKQWLRTSSGAMAAANEDWDPDAIEVAVMVDHGPGVTKRRGRNWSKRALAKAQNGNNLVGTLEFDGADLWAGDVTHAQVVAGTAQPMSRLALKPGMRVRYVGYQGGSPVLHTAGVNVDSDTGVRAAVDTKGRTLQSVGAIIARNHPSRRDPAREWLAAFRNRPTSFDTQIIWSEIGGILSQDVRLVGGQWNTFQMVLGQEGEVRHTLVQLEDSPSRFVMCVTCKPTGEGWLQARCPNPLAESDAWNTRAFQQELRREKIGVYAAGAWDQPLGYAPGIFADEDGATGDPITGLHEDEMTFPYFTFDNNNPVAWVSIWAETDSVVRAGRMFWHLNSEGS